MILLNRRHGMLVLIALGAIAAVLVVRGVLGSASVPGDARNVIDYRQPHRTISGNPKSPDTSTIDSASPTCTRPVAGTGVCTIQWYYMSVAADPGAYVVSMTVTIDDRLRAYHSGFFQTYMVIPGDMTAPGFQVTCGLPDSDDEPEWGRTYAYTLRARDTAGLESINRGSVTCPADTVKAFVPLIQK